MHEHALRCVVLWLLLQEYRDSRKVIINVEHRLIASMSADYQSLTLMQKVEVRALCWPLEVETLCGVVLSPRLTRFEGTPPRRFPVVVFA